AFRGVLCDALAGFGFKVHQAGDGGEALELIAAQPMHFVLLDLHMPRVTGLDALRRLLEFPDRPPCALMSAELTDEIVAEARQMQVYRVLSKPFRVSQIREIVCGALAETYGWKPV
ncbi:MAG: response regulator, partial [Planctomycetota bacterium]